MGTDSQLMTYYKTHRFLEILLEGARDVSQDRAHAWHVCCPRSDLFILQKITSKPEKMVKAWMYALFIGALHLFLSTDGLVPQEQCWL